jgi:PDZ domain-containing protein
MHLRRRWFSGVLAAAAILCVAALLPLPLYLVAPGAAIDLSSAVIVGSTAAPRDRFFLTDVRLIRASPLRLALALLPGIAVTKADTVVPNGESGRHFEDTMHAAMLQSQSIAAVVGERAAGLAVPLPAARVEVEAIDAASTARGLLAAGDIIASIDRRAVREDLDVRAVVAAKPAGTPLRVAFERAGVPRVVTIRTVLLGGRVRLGVILGQRYGPVRLAVPVRYAVGNVGGSSGGLMMALRIYEGLRMPARGARGSFAGTGTIALDGRVGAIDGTRQKLIAAKRAGARVFFVPRANFADIAGERDLRVVPVDTFGQARRVLDDERGNQSAERKRIAQTGVGGSMPTHHHHEHHLHDDHRAHKKRPGKGAEREGDRGHAHRGDRGARGRRRHV